MRYLAALFDLDGTLLNTLDDLADSMNGVLTDLGMPIHEPSSYRRYVGDGMLNLALRAAPKGTTVETGKRMVGMMDERYGRNWHNKTGPYAGIPELLSELARRGVKLAVLSNKPHRFAKIVVNRFFPEIPFAAVYGERDGVPRKPDPAAALDIARELGVPPEQFIYFGDSDTDMRTANAAGMFAAGVAWGFRSTEELTRAGARTIIEKPEQAPALLADEETE